MQHPGLLNNFIRQRLAGQENAADGKGGGNRRGLNARDDRQSVL